MLDAGTGFMMISKREVIDKMVKDGYETRYTNDPNKDPINPIFMHCLTQ